MTAGFPVYTKFSGLLTKETIERVFADAKEKHGMRYTLYCGLAQVSNWVRLKFAAMNLKKLAIWKSRCSAALLLDLLSLLFPHTILSGLPGLPQTGRFSIFTDTVHFLLLLNGSAHDSGLFIV